MLARFVTIVFLLMFSKDALAQYTVGNYYYNCPVGVPWNDPRCSRQEVRQRSPQQPSYRWQDKWGAIYIDSSTGSIGATADALTEQEAEATALQRCQSDGSQHCNKAEAFVNSCGVVAWPKGGGGIATQVGADIRAISRSALDLCQKYTARCDIALQICASPKRIPANN